jgi:hypothetical protein
MTESKSLGEPGKLRAQLIDHAQQQLTLAAETILFFVPLH